MNFRFQGNTIKTINGSTRQSWKSASERKAAIVLHIKSKQIMKIASRFFPKDCNIRAPLTIRKLKRSNALLLSSTSRATMEITGVAIPHDNPGTTRF
ncbi:hypothetical protein V6N13_059599 [Hibiscus sabdariffa]|uniref:Uncharacterized protein n=1 Tax=Hibiscus sabdariffa TaxID=183260 RepID=A0ABR2GDP3_9ROSI